MKTTLLLILLILSFQSIAQHTFDWGYATEHLDGKRSHGRDIHVDNQNNTYVLASFSAQIDADPGAGSSVFNPNDKRNMLLQKLDPAGNLIWAKQFKGNIYPFDLSMHTDFEDNIIIVGSFSDSLDTDPVVTNEVLLTSAEIEPFMIKLDTDGNFIWSKQFEVINSQNDAYLADLVTDDAGNIYATGHFSGEINFGTTVKTATSRAVFVMRIDSNGGTTWVKTYGNSSVSSARNIMLRFTGNLAIAMNFGGSISLDNGGIYLSSLGASDGLVLEMSPNGYYLNHHRVSGSSAVDFQSLNEDAVGNMIVSGTFKGPIDFDPSPADYIISPEGLQDAFFLKMDALGELLWVKSIHSREDTSQFGQSIVHITDATVDAFNNLYFVGAYSGILDLDPGTDSVFTLPLGNGDGFILQLDRDGNYQWGGQLQSAFFGACYGVALDQDNNLLTTGVFHEFMDLDPGSGMEIVTGNSNTQMYVQKLNPPATLNIAENSAITYSYYPNPTKGNVTIAFEEAQTNLHYTIRSINGQLLSEGTLGKGAIIEIELPSNTGIYFVEMTSESFHEIIRLVKQ